MKTVIVTGSAGLIGSECVRRFAGEGYRVVGIDNDLRQWFFGAEASTADNRRRLIETVRGYEHCDFDIRDQRAVNELFQRLGGDVRLVVHTAAQPSHDWAARDPHADFTVNANGTLNAAGSRAAALPGCRVHLHLHEQGLWRHAEPPAIARAAATVGNRARTPVRAGH